MEKSKVRLWLIVTLIIIVLLCLSFYFDFFSSGNVITDGTLI